MGLTGETRTQLSCVGISTLTNSLLRRGLRNQFLPGIVPVNASAGNMVGPAYTLRLIPAREDIDTLAGLARPDNATLIAVEQCPANAVLIVSAGGETRAATAGDLLAGRLKARGCAGIVTDGGFRDVEGIRGLGFAAYQQRTASAASPGALHAADTQVPIGCAGVAVYPGDIVVGDAEGVVIIPESIAAEVAQEACEAAAYDEFAALKIGEGHPLAGIFPATDRSREAFAAWKSQRTA